MAVTAWDFMTAATFFNCSLAAWSEDFDFIFQHIHGDRLGGKRRSNGRQVASRLDDAVADELIVAYP